MKRTAERVLAIIGIVLTSLAFIFAIFMVIGQTGIEQQADLLEQQLMEEPNIQAGEAEMLVQAMIDFGSVIGWWAFIVHAVGLVLGIIGLVKLINRPKTAGILFLVSGGGMLLFTMGIALIYAALFIIAGIMCLVRKPPVNLEPQPE
ncbi:DUF4064 domain-containing protein [Natribacillus halophilus]|uniref:DUF4064 domain-containing protein n=1 Tax=Natribacillus halophilus TaxID=549003 RepID=A0A1G8LQA6_9BACI|nr:DUF4064 domain-containing protein [Natribacillus halophilus]SDI57901.1 Protein of unknown function [Natribacillus halophilus]